MKTFIRTIIVCVALNLMTAGFVLAQNAPDEEKQVSKEALVAEKETELARKRKMAEIAVRVAEKKAEAARRQMQMMEMMATLVARRIGSTLVIPAAEMKTEDLATITEDMAVMFRIFDKKLEQAHLVPVRGDFDFFGGGRYWSGGEDVFGQLPFFARDSRATQGIYLEGYGALFLMKVNFPLLPPPEALEEKEPEEEDTDPLWTQMRQEIYAPEEVDRTRRRTDRPEEKYDAEKVKELKETLIKTLKHAANIRGLKPDESVILTVIGKAGESGTRTTTRSYGPRSGMSSRISRGRSSMVRGAPGVPTVAASLLPTVLTIRAKKSDIDAFSKGELDFDEFRQKVQSFAY